MDTIRIIHNLPRSGATIISKTIGTQRNIVLLSEIHPEGQKIRDAMGVDTNLGDPLYQFQSWYEQATQRAVYLAGKAEQDQDVRRSVFMLISAVTVGAAVILGFMVLSQWFL